MNDRAAQTAALTAYARGFFHYRPRLSVTDWAQSSVELSGRVTEQSGPYSLALHPYVAEVLETIRNSNVKRVSLCWMPCRKQPLSKPILMILF